MIYLTVVNTNNNKTPFYTASQRKVLHSLHSAPRDVRTLSDSLLVNIGTS